REDADDPAPPADFGVIVLHAVGGLEQPPVLGGDPVQERERVVDGLIEPVGKLRDGFPQLADQTLSSLLGLLPAGCSPDVTQAVAYVSLPRCRAHVRKRVAEVVNPDPARVSWIED